MQSARRSDLAMDPCDAHIFIRRYFNINRQLLMCLGLWPYENKFKMYILRIVFISTLMILSVPQLIDVIVHTEDVDRQMLSIICLLSAWLMVSKIIGMILVEESMKEMHRRIANNWQLIQDESERDLLHKYSERARNVTIFYVVVVLASAAVACTLPCIPKILDLLMPLQNPRQEFSLTEGEYFIDKKAHFVFFFFLNYFGIMLVSFITATFETMYIVSVEHCCALYAIVRSRLALRRTEQESSSATEDDKSYEELVQSFQLHQHALTFTSLLNESYSIPFLCIMTAALFVFPLACCGVISQLNNPLRLLPFAIYSVVVLIQGTCLFYPGQRIIDHQLSICDAAYCNEWYATPLRTKKLLLMFMIRSSKPATITAGGLLQINLELYFRLCKTMFSYVTVALSFR